jgi:acetyl esterase/lipase
MRIPDFKFVAIQYSMKTLLIYGMAIMVIGTSCKKTADNPVNNNNGNPSIQAQELMNVSYGTDPMQKMDVYLPAGRTTANTKALILLHGGAWISGDKADMNDAVNVFKTTLPDFAIFNVNYRLASLPGTNLWPSQLDDINTVLNFIAAKSDEYKFNSNKTAIGGASAGAHLALLKAYKYNAGNIKAVVDMFGPTDMTDLYIQNTSYQPLLTIFMSGNPASNPAAYSNASPLYAVSASSVPTIILHGTADMVVPITESDSLNNRLAAVGVLKQYEKYAGEAHGFWSPANTADAYAKISAFLKLHVQ